MVPKVLRTVSVCICLIVIASFVIFAVQQTKDGSEHQQEELKGAPIANTTGGQKRAPGQKETKGTVHKTIDEASEQLTSPFAGVVSGSDSEWAIQSVKLILALLVYGFGLGFLARFLRVRT